jgi:uncharacterized protein YjdB
MGAKLSKRILSMFLVLTLVLSLVPAAFAADDDNLEFSVEITGPSSASLNRTLQLSANVIIRDKTTQEIVTDEYAGVYKYSYSWTGTQGLKTEEKNGGQILEFTGQEASTYEINVTVKVDRSIDGSNVVSGVRGSHTLEITRPSVSGVRLDKTDMTMNVGDSQRRTAYVDPMGGDVRWASDNTEVATVDTEGNVTAISPGEATITAISVEDDEFYAECKVRVNGLVIIDPANGDKRISTLSMYEGDDYKVAVQIFGISGAATAVQWSSNHSDIVSVDGTNGTCILYAEKSGEAIITARVAGYTGYTVTLNVTVTANPKTTIVVENISRAAPLNFGTIRGKLVAAADGDLALLSSLTAPTSGGIIYYDYHSDDEQGRAIGTSESFAPTEIGNLTFVPAAGATGVVKIAYTARTGEKNRTIHGTIEVHIKTTSQEISYSTINRNPVHFNGSDFERISQSLSSISAGKVVFSVPDVSRGTLYLGYNSENNYESIIKNDVEYSAADAGRVTFIPAAGFRGTVSIPFVLYNTSGSRFTGNKITISVSQSSAQGPVYNIAPGEAATLRLSDFRSYLTAMGGGNLNHIQFTALPAASQGTLYYNYRSGSGTPVTTGASYYSNRQPYLDQVSFVSASGFDGTVSIPFEVVDTQGTRISGTMDVNVSVQGSGDLHYTVGPGQSVSFGQQNFNNLCQQLTGRGLDYIQFTALPSSGRGSLTYNNRQLNTNTRFYSGRAPRLSDVVFTASNNFTGTVEIPFTGAALSGEQFSGTVSIEVRTGRSDLSYTMYSGRSLTFSAADFDNYAREVTGYSLNYVRFALPSSNRGVLYYDYGHSVNNQETRVTSSNQYYYGRSPYLDRVTFVPNVNFTGDVAISYTGYTNNGQQYNGVVNIRVNMPQANSTVRYSTEYDTVHFQASDFARVAPGTLSYITFTNPPAASAGRLHSGNLGTSTNVNYHYNGSPSISSLNFTPRAGYSGTVSIPYTGMTTSGDTFSGTVEITVSARSNSVYFSDVGSGSYGWAASAVDYLYSNQVVSGVGGTRYGPSRAIKRGDFALMLCKAFGLESYSVGSGFADVPNSAYYANAVGTLKDLGVVSGDGRRFRPTDSVTRQDAMVMLQKAMQSAGWTLYDGGASSLNSFQDGSNTSAYARGAVACMVQMGILSGDSQGRLNPRGTLNRAEMAVVLHKAMTY